MRAFFLLALLLLPTTAAAEPAGCGWIATVRSIETQPPRKNQPGLTMLHIELNSSLGACANPAGPCGGAGDMMAMVVDPADLQAYPVDTPLRIWVRNGEASLVLPDCRLVVHHP